MRGGGEDGAVMGGWGGGGVCVRLWGRESKHFIFVGLLAALQPQAERGWCGE